MPVPKGSIKAVRGKLKKKKRKTNTLINKKINKLQTINL